MMYMLDTNIIIYLIKKNHNRLPNAWQDRHQTTILS
jgi:hypothetical protein